MLLSMRDLMNMLSLLVFIPFLCLVQGKALLQDERTYEGNYDSEDYNTYRGFQGYNGDSYMNDRPLSSISGYGEYAPMIDGRSIYIPEVNNGKQFEHVRSSYGPHDEKSKHIWHSTYVNREMPPTYVHEDTRNGENGIRQYDLYEERLKGDHHRKIHGHFDSYGSDAMYAVKHPVNNRNYHEHPIRHQVLFHTTRPSIYSKHYNNPEVMKTLTNEKSVVPEASKKERTGYEISDYNPVVGEMLAMKAGITPDHKMTVAVEPLTKEHVSHVIKEIPITIKKPVVDSYDEQDELSTLKKSLVKKLVGNGDKMKDYDGKAVDVESGTKKKLPVTHVKDKSKKPNKLVSEVYDYGDYDERPVVVESLVKKETTKEEKHIENEYEDDEYDYDEKPIIVEALTKKKHATNVKLESHVTGEHENEYEEEYQDYDETPVVVEALVKKNWIANKDAEGPVVESLTKREPITHGHKEKQKDSTKDTVIDEYDDEDLYEEYMDDGEKEYGNYNTPIVVETLIKEKPVMVGDYNEDYDERPMVEALTKEHPNKHSQKEHPNKHSQKEHPNKHSQKEHTNKHFHKENPTTYVKVPDTKEYYDEDYDERPVVVEALIKKKKEATKYIVKEKIADGYDYDERPIVVNSLSKEKHKTVKKEKPLQNEKLSPDVKHHINKEVKEYDEKPFILAKEYVVENEYVPHKQTEFPNTKIENTETSQNTNLEVMLLDPRNGNSLSTRDESSFKNYPHNSDKELVKVGDEDKAEEFNIFGSGMDFEENARDLTRPLSFFPLDPSISSLMTSIQLQERQKFQKCSTPKNETGHCMPIQICSVPNVASNIEELTRSICTIDEVYIGICCPEFPVETIRVVWDEFPEEDVKEAFHETFEIATECGKLPLVNRTENSWPWMAPLVAKSTSEVFCGGALINEQYVLTATHCTTRIPQNQILVRLTRDSEQASTDFTVIEIKRHAQYNARTMYNDIALLKLSRRVTLWDFRNPVCLPSDETKDYTGKPAVLLGWKEVNGRNAVETLPTISNEECQSRLGLIITDSVLCAEHRSEETMCNAASGAPLLIFEDGRYIVVGVKTWNRNECDGSYPAIFTRISSYLGWIESHTN